MDDAQGGLGRRCSGALRAGVSAQTEGAGGGQGAYAAAGGDGVAGYAGGLLLVFGEALALADFLVGVGAGGVLADEGGGVGGYTGADSGCAALPCMLGMQQPLTKYFFTCKH